MLGLFPLPQRQNPPSKATSFPQGYFFIKCHKNGLVLDVDKESKAANAKVIVWSQKLGNDAASNQLWYSEDGFLYNRNSNLLLDVKDGRIEPEAPVIQYKKKISQDASNQVWGYDNGFIYLAAHPNLVLDVKHESDQRGAKVIIWERKAFDFENQLWDLEPIPTTASSSFGFDGIGAEASYSYRSPAADDVFPDVPRTEDLLNARAMVYGGEKRGDELTYALITAAAACQAVTFWEEKQQSEGKIVVHQVAKQEIADLAVIEVEDLAREYEYRGDIEQAKAAAITTAHVYYDREVKPMYSSYHI